MNGFASFIENAIKEISFAIIGHMGADAIFSDEGKKELPKKYEKIKESSSEDNILFAQLLAKILGFIVKDIQVLSYAEHQNMKTWFDSAATKSHLPIIVNVFDLLSEAYFNKFNAADKNVINSYSSKINVDTKYLLLAPLYSCLINKTDDERFLFIRKNFYDNSSEKKNPSIAANEYSRKNPLDLRSLKLTNEVNPIIIWNNFVANLYQLISRDPVMKNTILSYQNLFEIPPTDYDIAHAFKNDFVNFVATALKTETQNDLTGKNLGPDVPIFNWLHHWTLLPNDSERLKVAASAIVEPHSFEQALQLRYVRTKAKITEIDKKHANATLQPGGLAFNIMNSAKNLRRG